MINTPIPRIFLSTRFGLSRICDWINRGHLICRLGAAGAVELKASTGIVCVTELKAIAVSGAADMRARTVSALRKAMRLDGDEGAALMLNTVTLDETIDLLLAFGQTVIVQSVVAAGERTKWSVE